MKDLIEQLERAKGPDRDIDVAIWATITCPSTYRRIEPGKSYSTWQMKDRMGEWHDYYPSLNAERYTESVDAAWTLAPKGWIRLVRDHNGRADYDGEGKGARAFASVYRKDVEPIFTSYGATPAIALCIAALKVRATQTASVRSDES